MRESRNWSQHPLPLSVRAPCAAGIGLLAWAAAASLAVLAISAGIVIGMKLERSRDLAAANQAASRAAGGLGAAGPVHVAHAIRWSSRFRRNIRRRERWWP